MKPEEFVYRCIDAAISSNEVQLPPRIDMESMTLRNTAWVLSFYKMPIVFERMGMTFEISLLNINEVSNIACKMDSPKSVCSAALVFSKINREWFSHWTEYEGETSSDLTLLRLGTDGYRGMNWEN